MKKTCLIIGGGTGMGLGLANEFASQTFYPLMVISGSETILATGGV